MILAYNDDCISTIPYIPQKVNMILTDLPYGTTNEPWDMPIDFNELWKAYKTVSNPTTPILLFAIEPFASKLRLSNKHYKYDIYWQKERITNVFQVKKRPGKIIENICVFYEKQPTYHPQMVEYEGTKRTNKIKNGRLGKLIDSSTKKPYQYHDTGKRYPLQIVQFPRDSLTNAKHPTQKPVALLEYLILTYTNQGDWILDSCMGSGSTAVACKHTNRNFIGYETDPHWYDIALKRIMEE